MTLRVTGSRHARVTHTNCAARAVCGPRGKELAPAGTLRRVSLARQAFFDVPHGVNDVQTAGLSDFTEGSQLM